MCVLSRFGSAQLYVTRRTVTQQAPLPLGFCRQEYWVGCHALLQGIFPTQGSNPHLLSYSGFFTTEPPEKPHICYICNECISAGPPTCASCISCIGRQILETSTTWEASYLMHDVCYIIKVLSALITTIKEY